MTIPLSKLRDKHLPFAGAKAVTLGKLLKAGMPVPTGFVLTASAFQEFASAVPEWKSVLSARIDPAAEPHELAAISAKVQKTFLAGAMPAELEVALQRALDRFPNIPLWAVRSSAISEDSPRNSFAGQHDSFLNVSRAEVSAQVRRCWASLFSPRAMIYRARNQLSPDRAGMAVIIQQMVAPEVAGVLFTADPASGDRNRIVIEYARGLGDQVVSGHVIPQRIVLSKWSFEILEQSSANPANASAVLDEAMAARLAEQAWAIERLLGGPLDIEWAIARGGELQILQARPITGMPDADSWEARQIWGNINVGEIMPDVATPITFSILKELVGAMGCLLFRLVGAPEAGKAPALGLVAGRIYMNANTLWTAIKSFWFPLGNVPMLANAIGGGHKQVLRRVIGSLRDEDLPDLGFRWYKHLLSLPRLTWQVVIKSRGQLQDWVELLKARVNELVQAPLETMSTPELARFFCQLARDQFIAGGLFYIARQALWLWVFEVARQRWLRQEQREASLGLFSGLGRVPEAEAAVELWKLAAQAHANPATGPLINSGETWAELRPKLEQTEPGREWLKHWHAFMAEHGHHCRGELELFNARWFEKPDYMLGQVRGYLRGMDQFDLLANRKQMAEQRQRLTEQCLSQLHNPVQRWLFTVSLRNVQSVAVNREEWKNQAVRQITLMRRTLLLLGKRLQQDGLFSSADDIFFLQLGEIEPAVDGENTNVLRDLVAMRRREYENNLKLNPPGTVLGRYHPGAPAAPPPKPGTKVLEGTAVSPGIVTGRAKVISAADDHERVLPGEILIASSTDPAWTPYFVGAAGVAIGQGGVLSHGSVVAREFGLPGVTNLGSALQAVRTGDLVQVDGNRGRLVILEQGGGRGGEL